jgi:Ca2+-transporting ATPase
MGCIGRSLKITKRPPSSLQSDTRAVVKKVTVASLGFSIFIAAIWWIRDGEALRGILMGLTFAMSTIPEEFPVVLTIFMALGAWRISKKNVLTRQMNAVEALGAATILCVDKTGTLTENKMTVSAIWTDVTGVTKIDLIKKPIATDQKTLIYKNALASDPNGGDPMDVAAIEIGKTLLPESFSGLKIKKTFPLIRPLLAVGFAWAQEKENHITIASKGAPESVLDLCRISGADRTRILEAVQIMARPSKLTGFNCCKTSAQSGNKSVDCWHCN